MGVGGQHHAPAGLTPGTTAGTPGTGGLSGPQGLPGRVWKITTTGFDPRTVQPGARRYTDWTVPVHWVRTSPAIYMYIQGSSAESQTPLHRNPIGRHMTAPLPVLSPMFFCLLRFIALWFPEEKSRGALQEYNFNYFKVLKSCKSKST
jgi:hypothetical protein